MAEQVTLNCMKSQERGESEIMEQFLYYYKYNAQGVPLTLLMTRHSSATTLTKLLESDAKTIEQKIAERFPETVIDSTNLIQLKTLADD